MTRTNVERLMVPAALLTVLTITACQNDDPTPDDGSNTDAATDAVDRDTDDADGIHTTDARPDTTEPQPDVADTTTADTEPARDADARDMADGDTDASTFALQEWGTLTGVVGSDGSYLQGVHHDLAAYPTFVHRLAYDGVSASRLGAGEPYLPQAVKTASVGGVLHFYTDRDRQVDVEVTMDAWPAAWFPAANDRQPSFPPACASCDKSLEERGVASLQDGRLAWSLQLSNGAGGWADVPSDSAWAGARGPEAAATVETGDEADRQVAYATIGGATLPFGFTIENTNGRRRITVKNEMQAPVEDILLLDVHENVGRIVDATPKSGAIAPGGEATLSPAPKEAPVEKGRLVDRSQRILGNRLTDAGLTEREAEAATDAWLQPVFRRAGYRLLMVMPPSWVAKQFPLTVEPAPDQVTRVYVARVEILTSDDEQTLLARVRDAYHNDQTLLSIADQNDPFQEARFRRACQLGTDKSFVEWCSREVAKLAERRFGRRP